jgi:hypothetical protein
MKPITSDEKDALLTSAANLKALGDMVEKMATAAPNANGVTEISLDDLVPTGNLSELSGRIRENSPVTDEELEGLITAAKADIETNSRFNGLLQNVTHIAQIVRTTVLPLLV